MLFNGQVALVTMHSVSRECQVKHREYHPRKHLSRTQYNEPSLLQMLTSVFGSDCVKDRPRRVDMLDRSSSGDHTDMVDRLCPLIQGLVLTRDLRESIAV